MKSAISIPALPPMDEDGLLCNPNEWNEVVAREMAQHIGIDILTDEHWDVIYSLREYFTTYGVAPAMKNICRRHDQDVHWVHDLFGTCLNAWRVAGLPNPGEEAKSYMSDM